jgi:hypothetical protein
LASHHLIITVPTGMPYGQIVDFHLELTRVGA